MSWYNRNGRVKCAIIGAKGEQGNPALRGVYLVVPYQVLRNVECPGLMSKASLVSHVLIWRVERFNDWGGRGYDDFVPGEVTKTAPSGDEAT